MADGSVISGFETTEAEHSTAGMRSNHARRRLAAVYGPIAVLLMPFWFHHSKDAVFLWYSWDYLLFLLVLQAGGLCFAAALLRLVRRRPADRQVALAWMLTAVAVAIPVSGELILGAIEGDVFADHRRWGHVRSAFMGFELGPNRDVVRPNDYGVDYRYRTGPDCLRVHPTPRVERSRERLIVVMGGSSAFGYGLNDDETWAQQMERSLRERFGPQVTVLNAGNSGHTSLQQLIRLYLRVLPLKPEVVLYYGMVNDVRTNGEIDAYTLQAPILLDLDVLGVSSTRDLVRKKNAGKCWYFRNSLLISHAKRLYENLVTPAGERAVQRWMRRRRDDEFAAAADAYLRNLDTMRALCVREGIEFVPMTFIANSEEGAPTGLAYYNRTLRAHCAEHGYKLIDLLPAFGTVSEPERRAMFYKDQYHPSAAGATFIAGQAAAAVARLFDLGPRAADTPSATAAGR